MANMDTAKVGQWFDYVVTVTNNGPAANAGFTLVDELPDGVDFVEFANPATDTACNYISGSHEITCTLAGLPYAGNGPARRDRQLDHHGRGRDGRLGHEQRLRHACSGEPDQQMIA